MTIAIDDLLEWFEQTPWLARAPRDVQRHYARLARECYARRGTHLEAPPDWRDQTLVWVIRSGRIRLIAPQNPGASDRTHSACHPPPVARPPVVHHWASGDAFIWPALAWPTPAPPDSATFNGRPGETQKTPASVPIGAPVALEDALLLAVPIVGPQAHLATSPAPDPAIDGTSPARRHPASRSAMGPQRLIGLGDVPIPWPARAQRGGAEAASSDAGSDIDVEINDAQAAADAAHWAERAPAEHRLARQPRSIGGETDTIADLIRPIPVVARHSSLQQVAAVMQRERSGAILLGDVTTATAGRLQTVSPDAGRIVVSPQQPLPWSGIRGIITDRDLRRALAEGLAPSSPAEAAMSVSLHTISSGARRGDAVLRMLQHGVHHLPVVAPATVPRASPTAVKTGTPQLVGQVTAVALGQAQATEVLGLERDIASAPDVDQLAALAPRLYDLYLALHRRQRPLDEIDTLLALVLRRFCTRLAALLLPEATREDRTSIERIDFREPMPGRPPVWPRPSADCPVAGWLEALPDTAERRLLPRAFTAPHQTDRAPAGRTDPTTLRLPDAHAGHQAPTTPAQTFANDIHPRGPVLVSGLVKAHNVTRVAWIVSGDGAAEYRGSSDMAQDVAQRDAVDLVTVLLDPIARLAQRYSGPDVDGTTPTARRLACWIRATRDKPPDLITALDALLQTWNRTRRVLGLRALHGVPPVVPFPASAAPPDLRGLWNLALTSLSQIEWAEGVASPPPRDTPDAPASGPSASRAGEATSPSPPPSPDSRLGPPPAPRPEANPARPARVPLGDAKGSDTKGSDTKGSPQAPFGERP